MKWILPHNISEQDILNSEGFVYIITNLITNKKYIGKKFVYSKRTKLIKGKKKKTKQVSDWKTYTGSCESLTHDIKTLGEDNFQKEILTLHRTRTECNYTELEQQIICDVLRSKDDQGDFRYYNANIAHKYFRNNIK